MRLLLGGRMLLLEVSSGSPKPIEDGLRISFFSRDMLGRQEFALLFDDLWMPGLPPTSIVVNESVEIADFYAWCATYLECWQPLSAITSVYQSNFPFLEVVINGGTAPRLPPSTSRAFAAACIAEYLLESGASVENPIPMLGVRSTFGYAAARAMSRYRDVDLSLIAMNAEDVDSALGHPRRRVRKIALDECWSNFTRQSKVNLFHPDRIELQELAVSVLTTGTGMWLARGTVWEERLSRLFSARRSREESFGIALNLVQMIEESGIRVSVMDAVSIAYMFARLSDGPMSHWDVVRAACKGDPRVLLWYSILSSSSAPRSSDKRIETAVTRTMVELSVGHARPDVSATELVVLARSKAGLNIVRTGASLLNVELYPFVVVPVRTTPTEQVVSQVAANLRMQSEFDRAISNLRSMLFSSEAGESTAVKMPGAVVKASKKRRPKT